MSGWVDSLGRVWCLKEVFDCADARDIRWARGSGVQQPGRSVIDIWVAPAVNATIDHDAATDSGPQRSEQVGPAALSTEWISAAVTRIAGAADMCEPFELQAAATPQAVALMDGMGQALTYGELDQRANRLAHDLLARGAGPGQRIGVLLDRSVEQYIAIFGIIKAGSIYVPMDVDLPDDRLQYVLAHARPCVVITQDRHRVRVAGGEWSVCEPPGGEPVEGKTVAKPLLDRDPGAVFTIFYTSGTTGQPKGVAYPTRGALAGIAWMQGRYPQVPEGTALAIASIGFDTSVWEIFWPLYCGARVVVCTQGAQRDPARLAQLVERHGVELIHVVPTMMTPLLDCLTPRGSDSLRWVLCGGEPITPRIRDKFYATVSRARLVNCYGPTETGCATDMELHPDPGAPVPLGRTAAHFTMHVLDEDLRPAPTGTRGEGYLGGRVGLADGYWRAPARTAERFLADPSGRPGGRMYRTGDVCSVRPDGVLEHHGRVDRQVKVHGVRVELGEIESVLSRDTHVRDCAVIAYGEPTVLIGFVVPTTNASVVDLDRLRLGLRRALRAEMVPRHLVIVETIPTTVNAKVDTGELVNRWHDYRRRARVAPESRLEAEVMAVFRAVCLTAAGEPSVLDTLSDLGGSSLLAGRIMTECAARCQVEPDAGAVLTGTIRDVADSIGRRRGDPSERHRRSDDHG